MSEQSLPTTFNGHEIQNPRDALSFDELRDMTSEYGLTGSDPIERVQALKNLSKESLALFITDLNSRLQGSDDSLVHEKVMKIGDKVLIAPDDRYQIFSGLIEAVKSTGDDINPERVGDALALTTVLLHPFKDGNGRTARMFGFIFRDDFDAHDGSETFAQLSESRDVARARGGSVTYGYVPYLPEGTDQSDPVIVAEYLQQLISSEDPYLYMGPYGQAELHAPEVVPA